MKSRRLTAWILVIATLAAIAGLQAAWDASAAPYQKQVKLAALKLAEPALPSVAALRLLSLNQESAVADLLWLENIQYFGQGNPYGKYPSLGPILNTITNLDPKFAYPYQFGLVVLPFMGQVPAAQQLGERAQINIPNDGLVTFYFASLNQLNLKDYKRAGDLYAKAATLPGGPPISKELAGVSLSTVNNSLSDRLIAIAFWQTVRDNAKDDDQKQQAENWITHMQIVYNLELTAQNYKKNTGAYPASLQALKDAGYLSAIPVSPIGRALILDPTTGRIDFSHLATVVPSS